MSNKVRFHSISNHLHFMFQPMFNKVNFKFQVPLIEFQFFQKIAIVFMVWFVLPSHAHVFRFPTFYEPSFQAKPTSTPSPTTQTPRLTTPTLRLTTPTPSLTTPETPKATTAKIDNLETVQMTTVPVPEEIPTPASMTENSDKVNKMKGLTGLEEAKRILQFLQMKIGFLEQKAK